MSSRMRLPALLIAGALVGATAASGAALLVTSAHLTTSSKSYGAPTTCTLTADADSYVVKDNATTNYGSATNLDVDPRASATRRTFLHFPISNCAIPVTAIVRSAKVRLTLTAASPNSARTLQLRLVSASWIEGVINWNNQPAVSATVTSATTVTANTAAGTIVEWTATGDVQARVTGSITNNGWRIADGTEGGGASLIVRFSSREAASGQPQLVITYVQ